MLPQELDRSCYTLHLEQVYVLSCSKGIQIFFSLISIENPPDSDCLEFDRLIIAGLGRKLFEEVASHKGVVMSLNQVFFS
jgi:hypothetical protein